MAEVVNKQVKDGSFFEYEKEREVETSSDGRAQDWFPSILSAYETLREDEKQARYLKKRYATTYAPLMKFLKIVYKQTETYVPKEKEPEPVIEPEPSLEDPEDPSPILLLAHSLSQAIC